ncbi:hypothetical protein V6Z11_A07G128100 [Gossypium hirsutum]
MVVFLVLLFGYKAFHFFFICKFFFYANISNTNANNTKQKEIRKAIARRRSIPSNEPSETVSSSSKPKVEIGPSRLKSGFRYGV